MEKLKSLTMILVAGSALTLGACGGDDTNPTPQGGSGQGAGGTGGEGATGGAGGDGGTGGGATVDYGVNVADFDNNPVSMAGVALDLSDGGRVEGLTDGNGAAAIPVPLELDVDHITVHKDGYSYITAPAELFMGQTPTLLIQQDAETTGWFTLSGTASNMNDPANDIFVVDTTLGLGFDGVGGDTYSILLPPNEAFDLIAFDASAVTLNAGATARTFYAVSTLSQAALTGDTTVDIDFNTGTPATASFTTSLTQPMDTALAMDGGAIVNVTSGAFAGGSTTCTPTGMQYDCVGDYWDLGGPLQTIYIVAEQSVIDDGVGRGALSFQSGGPAVGMIDPGFPNPPTVTSPAGAGPHPVKIDIEYTVDPGGPSYDAEVFNVFTDDRLVGIGFGDGQTMRVPDLPSTSDEAAQYAGEGLTVQAFTCVAGPGGQCTKVGRQIWAATAP